MRKFFGREQQLEKLVGLVGKNVESAAPYFKSGRKNGNGVQVDYLVQLPRCTYVIEIKRRRTIGKSVEDEVQQKIERLRLPRNRTIKTVLVYEGELDPSVEEDGFFDFVIPAERLLRR